MKSKRKQPNWRIEEREAFEVFGIESIVAQGAGGRP